MVAMSRDDAAMSTDDVGMGSQDHMQPEVSNEASTSTDTRWMEVFMMACR
jgi:hypothetical protein